LVLSEGGGLKHPPALQHWQTGASAKVGDHPFWGLLQGNGHVVPPHRRVVERHLQPIITPLHAPASARRAEGWIRMAGVLIDSPHLRGLKHLRLTNNAGIHWRRRRELKEHFGEGMSFELM